MKRDNLVSYLNDHLAGAAAALELIDALAKAADDRARVAWLQALRAEIESDQNVLRGIIARLSAPESTAKQAAAWMAEKVGQAKLAVTAATRHSALAWFEGLEILELGIEGKAALWRVLGVLAARRAELHGFDFAALGERARRQADDVERARIAAAPAAFGVPA